MAKKAKATKARRVHWKRIPMTTAQKLERLYRHEHQLRKCRAAIKKMDFSPVIACGDPEGRDLGMVLLHSEVALFALEMELQLTRARVLDLKTGKAK